jgi:glycosyltransferase involved in cell wall biosynthesis
MIAGAGYLASAASARARLIARVARLAWPVLLLGPGSRVIVQNEEDRRDLAALRPDAAPRIVVIPGSGVDLDHFRPAAFPAEPVVFAYAGRMIAIKGVATLVAAHQMLRQRGSAARLVLAGAPDPENPSAIDEATLRHWGALPGIAWQGAVADIRTVWAGAHVAVLASRGGEGLPKSLLEAAAMGRPIVATDVPGTRAIARAGENALLVAPGDAAALAEALAAMAGDAALRARCGAASRRIVEQGFSDAAVGAATEAVYRALVAELGPGKSTSVRPITR